MTWSNKFSRLFGRLANHSFPKPIQNFINTVYVKIFKIDLSEFHSISSYTSLNALFTRALKQKREVDEKTSIFISPCDSLITECGKVEKATALQIKGMSYRVSELLGENENSFQRDELDEFFYLNFYLSPSDYHHYHAPCDMKITEVRYFGGKLLPVNLRSLQKNSDVFVQNERVVIKALDPFRETMYFVAVGALNVGQMVLHFEPKVQTNCVGGKNNIYLYRYPISLKKGEEIGLFKMGSTIVVFNKNLSIIAQKNMVVKFGENVGKFI